MISWFFKTVLDLFDKYIEYLEASAEDTDKRIDRLAEDYKIKFERDVAKLRKQQAAKRTEALELRSRI